MKKILLITLLFGSLFAQVKEPIQVPYVAYQIKMGKNFDMVNMHCLTCHSFGYIINQGPQSKPYWAKKVQKMITHFKAPIPKEDADKVTEYLFEHYGNGAE